MTGIASTGMAARRIARCQLWPGNEGNRRRHTESEISGGRHGEDDNVYGAPTTGGAGAVGGAVAGGGIGDKMEDVFKKIF
jgi:hypothetical protein